MLNGTQITIVGNLGNDPEMRYTPTGLAVTSFSVGVANRRVKRGNEWEDNGSTWYRVTAWRDLAENVAQSLVRGSRVIVVGILASRDWDDKEGGKHTSWEIVADACGPDLSFANVAIARTKRATVRETVPADERADSGDGFAEEPPF
jgi:single-strand DNA-binding protein